MRFSDRQSVCDQPGRTDEATTASPIRAKLTRPVVAETAPLVSLRARRRERAIVDRRAGRLLRLLRDHQLYRALGFVRLSDYVLERLGFSYRTAQELIGADEALEHLPLAAAAFEAGEITEGHVRLLKRVAAPASEAYWVGLARRLGVRGFARAVAAARRGEADAASQGVAGGNDLDAGDLRSTADSALDVNGVPRPAADELEVVSIASPAWIVALWRQTLSLVRRLSGTDLPPGSCFEMVLAEVAADVGMMSEAADGRQAGHRAPVGLPGLPPSARTLLPNCSTTGSRSDRGGTRDSIGLPDARAIDAELRRLVTVRQRHEGALAEHLRLVALNRGYRDEGFTSLEEYAADRFGLASRSLYHLLALGRVLRALPVLRQSFLTGQVTARQATLIGGVASSLTMDAWVRRAQSVTLRRLEDEVNFWIHLKVTRPHMWDLLKCGPLPDGVALAPGQPARLQPSASRREGSPQAVGDSAITAEDFLLALEEDESTTPLPARFCCLRLRVEPGVSELWRATIRHLRAAIREDLAEWEALALVLREFLSVWDNSETRRQRRENPTLERDGWRCTAPGCRSIGTGRLHTHHIVFRSAGGTDDDTSLLTSLCSGHHLGLLHEGRMRCSGRAPGNLAWEMGVEPGRRPFLVYQGEMRIGGEAS